MTSSPAVRTRSGRLPADLAEAVRTLAAGAARADGTAALSEASLIGLGRDDGRHVLAGGGEQDGPVVGYDVAGPLLATKEL